MGVYSRRDFLRLSAVGGAGALALSGWSCAPAQRARPDFAVAFHTDMHVYSEKGAADGFASSIRHAFDRPDPPQLLITGGDLAFDILKTGVEEADAQYDLFDKALEQVRVPTHHTLGNHDCLGVDESSGLGPEHSLYGKAYFLRRFNLHRTYYSFDYEGWHFVILDSVDIQGRDYRGWIDAEQLAWIEDDLATAVKPTLVITHIPLFTTLPERLFGSHETEPPHFAVGNCNEVIQVLSGHRVPLVLAGHVHINESLVYQQTEFANVGAVSGNWWDGPRDGFEEGYARLEFYGGQVRWRYVDYGWDAEEALLRKTG